MSYSFLTDKMIYMILGIDPGLANVGWAVMKDENSLVEFGCIATDSKKASSQRLGQINMALVDLIDRFKVTELALEKLFFARNVKSASKVSEAIGVIKICGQSKGLSVFEYTPLQIKMSLVGYGRAEKDQVEYMVKNFLNRVEPITPDHASDAVAVALTHLFTNRELI